MSRDWMALADEALEMDGIARERAREALAAPPEATWELLAAARRVRTRHHGNRVRVHVLCNAKLGGPYDRAQWMTAGVSPKIAGMSDKFLIGAGGGGFLMFYAHDRVRLRKAMQEVGLLEVRFGFDYAGTQQVAGS